MANLEFTYKLMGASKSAYALIKRYQLMKRGFNVLLLKPSIDDTDGTTIVKSRVVEDKAVYNTNDKLRIKFLDEILECNCVNIDEVVLSNKDKYKALVIHAIRKAD